MKARAALHAELVDGRSALPVLQSQAPILLRRTPGAVHLVSGAGGPLGGDDLRLDVVVGPGASLTVHSVAATVALPGRGGFSTLLVSATVAAGGRLEWLPEPTVVADGAEHHARIEVDLAPDAELLLRDEVVLGRSGERGGRMRSAVHVTRDGRPVLRSELVLDGADPSVRGVALLAGGRAAGSLLDVAPRYLDAPAAGWVHPGCSAMPLTEPAVLVTAVGTTAPELRARLTLQEPALV